MQVYPAPINLKPPWFPYHLDRSSCVHCLRPMAPGSLRVRKRGRSHHLRCFRPPLSEPIVTSQHIRMHGIERHSDVEKVRRWVDRWNAKFVLKESQLPAECCSKRVETAETDKKRLLLLIFAFLSSTHVETAVALTCKEWFHVTRVDELWRTLYSQEYAPDPTDSPYRQKFIATQMNCCWHCKKPVTVYTVCRRCPYYKKPLCKQCSASWECRTIMVDWYLLEKMINKSLMKPLQFPSFLYKKERISYIHLLSAQILPYAEQRRQQLLSLITEAEYREKVSEEFVQRLLNFDLERLYTDMGFVFADKEARWLAYFCGKDAETEDLRGTMRDLLEHPTFK